MNRLDPFEGEDDDDDTVGGVFDSSALQVSVNTPQNQSTTIIEKVDH